VPWLFLLERTLEVTQDNILAVIIVLSFLGGIIACRFFTRLLEVSHAARLVQSTVYRILLMCSKINDDANFILEMKHRWLYDSGVSDKQIYDLKKMDTDIMDKWREMIIHQMLLHSPPVFSFVMKFTTWGEAMQQLREMEEHE